MNGQSFDKIAYSLLNALSALKLIPSTTHVSQCNIMNISPPM